MGGYSTTPSIHAGKKLRVLFLDYTPISDGVPWYLARLVGSYGIELDITSESEDDIWDRSLCLYRVAGRSLKLAEQLTNQKAVDLVIIGNNLGTGIQKAEMISEDLRDRTIITWNSYSPGLEKEYIRLGYKRFCSRRDGWQVVLDILNEIPELGKVSVA